jgi:hypothetical protein
MDKKWHRLANNLERMFLERTARAQVRSRKELAEF